MKDRPARAAQSPAVPNGETAPPAHRRDRLSEAVEGVEPTHHVPLPGGLVQVPVVQVPQSLLLYRVDNGRLVAELEERLLSEGRDWQALHAEAESPQVQHELHELLMAAAADARGPILQELERQGTQTEPLLVDAQGIVVNGNRRLAAMRELMHRDPERFALFDAALVAVLPSDIASADIEFAEAALQMAPETKLGYGWVNRRIKLRRQRDELALPADWIRDAYQMQEAAQLDREIGELELAETFLEDFAGAPGHYATIADAEALFVGLAAQLAQLPERLRTVWRHAGFAMIENRETLNAALDREFPFADPAPKYLPSAALRRFAAERDVTDGEDAASPEDQPGDDLLGSLELVLADRDEAARNARDLLDAMSRVSEEHRERAQPRIMLRRIQDLRKRMDQLDPDRLNEAQQRRLRGEVAAIHAQAAYLLRDSPDTRFEQQKTGMVKMVSAYLRRWRAMRRKMRGE